MLWRELSSTVVKGISSGPSYISSQARNDIIRGRNLQLYDVCRLYLHEHLQCTMAGLMDLMETMRKTATKPTATCDDARAATSPCLAIQQTQTYRPSLLMAILRHLDPPPTATDILPVPRDICQLCSTLCWSSRHVVTPSLKDSQCAVPSCAPSLVYPHTIIL